MGWLIPLEAEQWELNRWGAHVRINLDWSRLDGIGRSRRSHRPPARNWHPLRAVPARNRHPLSQTRNPCGT